jgi:hypothetical protein
VRTRTVRSVGALAAVAVLAGACGTRALDQGVGAGLTSSASPKTAVEQSLLAIAKAPSYAATVTVRLSGLGGLLSRLGGLVNGLGASSPLDDGSAAGQAITPILQGKSLQLTVHGAYSRSLNASEVSFTLPRLGSEAAIVDSSAHVAYLKLPPGVMRLFEKVVQSPSPFATVPSEVRALVRDIAAHPGDWLKIDLTKLGRSSQLPAGLFNPASMQSGSFLKALDAAITGASVGGATSVLGVPVTDYKATLDPATVAHSLTPAIAKSSPTMAPAAPYIGKMFAALPKSVPFDVYVDHSGYARRVSATVALGSMLKGFADAVSSSIAGATAGLGMPAIPSAAGNELGQLALTVSADFSGFGASNDVVIPPASQVIDITPALAKAPKSALAL